MPEETVSGREAIYARCPSLSPPPLLLIGETLRPRREPAVPSQGASPHARQRVPRQPAAYRPGRSEGGRRRAQRCPEVAGRPGPGPEPSPGSPGRGRCEQAQRDRCRRQRAGAIPLPSRRWAGPLMTPRGRGTGGRGALRPRPRGGPSVARARARARGRPRAASRFPPGASASRGLALPAGLPAPQPRALAHAAPFHTVLPLPSPPALSPAPAERFVTSGGRRGTGRRCIRFLRARGARRERLPPPSPVRRSGAERGRLSRLSSPSTGSRCSAGPRAQCEAPLAISVPDGAGGKLSRDEAAAAAGGLGSLGGGTAPGDRAEARRHRWLAVAAGGSGRRRHPLAGGGAPRPGFAFPFGATSPGGASGLREGERETLIYLFVSPKGEGREDRRPARGGRASWRRAGRGGSPVTRGGGGGGEEEEKKKKPARSLASPRFASQPLRRHRLAVPGRRRYRRPPVLMMASTTTCTRFTDEYQLFEELGK